MQKLDEIIVIRDDKAKNHSVLILVRMEYALIGIFDMICSRLKDEGMVHISGSYNSDSIYVKADIDA